MPDDRALDRAIAKALGLTVGRYTDQGYPDGEGWYCYEDEDERWEDLPHYSESWEGAGVLLEALAARKIHIGISHVPNAPPSGRWAASTSEPIGCSVRLGPTGPVAVVAAAAEALGVDLPPGWPPSS